MKILTKNYNKGFLKIEIENLDDLWYLSYVIDKGNFVSSLTERKIKLGGEDQRTTKIIKKKVWLKIECEKIQFSTTSSELKISGKIAEGKEDIAAGDYHTLNVLEGTVLEIEKGKNGFLKYQIERIEDASKNKNKTIMLCAIDRGEASFAILKKYGYEIIATQKGDVAKKDYTENIKSSFFEDITKTIYEYSQRYSINVLVIGTVNFWKTYVQKELSKFDSKIKIIYTECSTSGENAIKEMITNENIKSALDDERFSIESSLVEEILSNISTNGNVAYGIKEVDECANLGAIEKLLISDGFIQKKREEEDYEKLESLMKTVDENKGNVFIISSKHQSGQQLDGLGGVGAILRFKVE